MKRKLSLLLSALIFSLTFSGCGNDGKLQTNNKPTGELGDGYPLKSEETLSYWCMLDGSVSANTDNLANTEFAKGLEERTGVKLEYVHPTSSALEQFNLMLASGELPDIIDFPWHRFAGGAQKAIDEGHILPLNDIIEKDAPNMKAYIERQPEVAKLLRTYGGSYFCFPSADSVGTSFVTAGPVMRKDWLDELELPVPETIDEWTVTLRAFKEKKGAEYPLSFANFHNFLSWGLFTGAYGVPKSFYLDNDAVKYGSIEPAFKDFITQMNSWYQEGLLDPNVSNVDTKIQDAYILQGKTGATAGSVGSGIGKWLDAMKNKETTFDLIGVPYPVLNKGDHPKFSQMNWSFSGLGAAITTKCKNVELAARFLDYGYSDEGMMYYNFGTEGKTYQMENGYPKYTDEIMSNPQGLSVQQALGQYTRASYGGPFLGDQRYFEQYGGKPQQQSAYKKWSDTDAPENCLPSALNINPEKSSDVAKKMNEITTYENSMMVKMIMGLEPIEKFDEYVAQIQELGIDEVLTVYQDAYDHCLKQK